MKSWIVKIEEEKNQRIKIEFNPLTETIIFYGQVRINNEWETFSQDSHEMRISLEDITTKIGNVIALMRIRLIEFENLNKGFEIIKTIGFEN